jgi:hypothetical protein
MFEKRLVRHVLFHYPYSLTKEGLRRASNVPRRRSSSNASQQSAMTEAILEQPQGELVTDTYVPRDVVSSGEGWLADAVSLQTPVQCMNEENQAPSSGTEEQNHDNTRGIATEYEHTETHDRVLSEVSSEDGLHFDGVYKTSRMLYGFCIHEWILTLHTTQEQRSPRCRCFLFRITITGSCTCVQTSSPFAFLLLRAQRL